MGNTSTGNAGAVQVHIPSIPGNLPEVAHPPDLTLEVDLEGDD